MEELKLDPVHGKISLHGNFLTSDALANQTRIMPVAVIVSAICPRLTFFNSPTFAALSGDFRFVGCMKVLHLCSWLLHLCRFVGVLRKYAGYFRHLSGSQNETESAQPVAVQPGSGRRGPCYASVPPHCRRLLSPQVSVYRTVFLLEIRLFWAFLHGCAHFCPLSKVTRGYRSDFFILPSVSLCLRVSCCRENLSCLVGVKLH